MKKKRMAALLAALLMAGVSASCGGSGSGGGSAANQEKTVDESGREMVGNMYTTGLPLVKEKESFTLFCDDSGKPEEKIMYPILEEQTNVHVELLLFPYDIAKEKKNILINSGDYPDAMAGWAMEENDILRDGMKEGLYIQLDDLINQYSPKMQEVLALQGVHKTMMLPDGNIYTIPYAVKAPQVPYAPYINQLWLDKLGLAMPTTTDELAEVLRAFKTQDPNGNSKADEIPLTSDKENLDFGLYAGYWGRPTPRAMLGYENGKLYFGPTTEEYKQAIIWLAGLYKEGLIDPEVFTHDQSQWRAKGNQMLYGVSMAYNSRIFSGEPLGKSLPPYAETDYVTLPVLKAPGVEKPVWQRDCYGVNVLKKQFAITDKAKNPALIIRYWDNVYQLDNSVQIQAGLLGKRLKKLDEGQFEYMDETLLSEAERNKYSWANMFTQSMPIFVPRDLTISGPNPPQENDRTDKLYEPYLNEAVPQVWTAPEDASRVTSLYTDIESYYKNQQAAFISGQTNIEKEWDNYIAQFDKIGLQEYIAIKQKAVDALNALPE